MSSDDNSDEDINCTPPELRAEAALAINNLLPAKSKEKYMNTYQNFISWKTDKNAHGFSENVFLAYFTELARTKKSSTLWAMYSMLKATIQLKHNIHIKDYVKLVAWLKRQSTGYTAKKSKVFTSENVEKFLNEAPDETYLAMKVALILGINGACRGMELTNITTKDIEFHGDIVMFKLRETKTNIDRSFVVGNEFMNIFNKYYALRPDNIKTDRLFLNYKNGKCTRQVIGRHTILSMPKQIATFLKLDYPDLYTGHCFRRTSATLLADSGANLLVLKRHGGWKSDKVAEGYIEDSVENKQSITKNITKNIVVATNPHTAKSQKDVPQPTSIYINPQPGCSRDPPVYIEDYCPPPKPPSTHTLPAAHFQPPVPHSQIHEFHDPQSPLGRSDPQLPLPSQQDQQSTSHTTLSQPRPVSEVQQTNISVPGKTITISISNCPNMSNVSFNIS